MSQEDTMTLVAKLVDQTSGPIREMSKEFHKLQDLLKKGGAEGSKASQQFHKDQIKLNEAFEKTHRTVEGGLTPAMDALGLKLFTTGTAIAGLITTLKEAGDSFYKIQNITARTGLQPDWIRAYQGAFNDFGISTEETNTALAAMGDHLELIGRKDPTEVGKWVGTFNNLREVLGHALENAKTTEERVKIFFKFLNENPDIKPVDKDKILGLVGAPLKLATVTAEQFKEGMDAMWESIAKHPSASMEALKDLNDAFRDLKLEMDGFAMDLVTTFGGPGVELMESFSKTLHQDFLDMKALSELVSSIGDKLGLGSEDEGKKVDPLAAGANKLRQMLKPRTFDEYLDILPKSQNKNPRSGYKPTSFIEGGEGGFSRSDSENMLSEGVKVGMHAAFRE